MNKFVECNVGHAVLEANYVPFCCNLFLESFLGCELEGPARLILSSTPQIRFRIAQRRGYSKMIIVLDEKHKADLQFLTGKAPESTYPGD